MFVHSNGARLHVQRLASQKDGPAPTVVSVHGLGMDTLASFYLSLAAPLAAAGVHVVTYDLRGHGRSEKTPTKYRLSDSADDLIGLLDALGITEPVHLVGNSYGGCVSFNVAVAAPERVASITLLDTLPAVGEEWTEGLEYLFSGAMADNEAVAAEVRREVLNQSICPDGERVDHVLRMAQRTLRETGIPAELPLSAALREDQVRSVTCPVLGIFGSRSWMVPLEPKLRELVPHARTEIIEGLGHFVLAEATDQVYRHLVDWVLQPSRS